MTLQSNLEDIIDQLNDIKEDLISVLLTKKDKTTNNSFDVNNKTLIELCAMTRNISATVKNTAVIPTPATEIAKPDIYSTHIDILNKIQYCNNLLRYTLRIYGVNFYNSNKLHELVKFLNNIGCSLDLTASTDYIDISLGESVTLTAQYEYENQPISGATIGFFTTNNVLQGTGVTNNEGKATFNSYKPGIYIARVIGGDFISLESNTCEVYGMQYFMDGRVDLDRDLEVDLYAGYYNDIDLVNDITIDNDRDINFNIEMNDLEENVVVHAYLDDNGDVVFVKYGDIPQYLARLEMSTDGTLIASVSPVLDYSVAPLINDITLDSNKALKITTETNEHEEDIIACFGVTNEGNLIYKKVND